MVRDIEAAGEVELDPVTEEPLRTGGPGSLPNFGNSNEKLTSLRLLTVLLLFLPVRYAGRFPASGGERPAAAFIEILLRYSFNSTFIFST